MNMQPAQEELLTGEGLRIRKIAEKFSTIILNGEPEIHKCFTTCYPLSIHLENRDIPNSILIGQYKGQEHYWLFVNDCELIVDPTIRQFETYAPSPVFVGKNSGNYTPQDKRLDEAIKSWKQPFIDNPTDQSTLPQECKKVFLGIILKAATMLYVEIKQMPFLNLSPKLLKIHKVYFDLIHEFSVATK